MKLLQISILASCLAAGTLQASTVFTITKTPNVVIDIGNSHIELVWDFTTQPGWNSVWAIDSIHVTETFSGIASGSTFSSTIIPYNTTTPNLGAANFILFAHQTLSSPQSATFNVPSPLPVADISNGGTLGQFDTRTSRYDAGSFTFTSMAITITAETPEPASVALLSVGFTALALFARRRFRVA